LATSRTAFNGYDFEAEIEILPEKPLGNGGFKIPVGCGNDAHIHRNGFIAA